MKVSEFMELIVTFFPNCVGLVVPMHYVCHDMGLSLVDVVGDLHHDHSEGHRQAGHAAEEGDGTEQSERAGVHPRPVLVRLRTAARIIIILKIKSLFSSHH